MVDLSYIYIDDIIVYGRNFDEHIRRVEEVFTRLRDAGLKLKPDKCDMLQPEVVFLGHVVTAEGIKPNATNISKILEWPRPTTPRQVKQLVAMGSYYRRYVENFATIVRPMVDLTKKGKKFIWNEACEKSFQGLKKALVSTDVMGYPLNDAGSFILDVDASDVGIGGILHQVQDDRERVIAYASRALNKAEKNYCITEKELLAVRYFVDYFRQYLLGRHFTVRTDHQALVWLYRLREPSGKVARWIEILSQYDFSIEYRPGRKQGHCDALSRCENPHKCECPEQNTLEPLKCGPCKKCIKRAQDMMHQNWYKELTESQIKTPEVKSSKESDLVSVKALQEAIQPGTSSQEDEKERQQATLLTAWSSTRCVSDLQKLQSGDPDIGPILEAKQAGKRPSSQDMVTRSPACRHYWILWESLVVIDKLLFKKFAKQDGSGEYLQFIVPSSMKKEILYQMHDSMVSGHLGCKKTKAKVLQRFYWYALKEDINLYIQRCDICAADKKPTKVPRAPMGSLQVGAPGDCVATDYLGPLPVTDRGHRYILLFTDHFTKNVEIVPVKNMTAEVCAVKLLNEVISRWGCPLAIHSDQGRTYESRVFQELCRMLEVRKTRTSVRNPRGNGQVERFNRTLIRMIKAYLCGEQGEWDLHLGCLAGAYRATPNESTRMTPNLLSIGREIRLPGELVFGSTNSYDGEEITSYGEYVDDLKCRMQHAHELARKYMCAASKRSKDLYDAKVSFHRYELGDIVWCLMETRTVGVAPKLERVFEGPFLIKQKLSEMDFVLQLDRDGAERPVHHNKIKPYEGNNPPKWVVKTRNRILSNKSNGH
ncbi:MAG: RNase H-like domain-containing protein [Candidatus Thiodiazotropha endolucinida]|nr:RNase H-like domain-containing protein [Candidatus Thiodiazotropha endolucinida]